MKGSLKGRYTQKNVWVILTEDEKQGVMIDEFGFWDLTDDLAEVAKFNSEKITKSQLPFIKRNGKKFVVKECMYTKQETLLPCDMVVGEGE